jgi:mRNA interferase MazF
MNSAKRSEVWLVNIDPTIGQEIQKTRPIVIISSDLFEPIPLRIAIPIASWQEKFKDRPFMVRINASPLSELDRDSAANVLQVRSLSTDRFVKKLGQVSEDILQEILACLVVCTDYEPKSRT